MAKSISSVANDLSCDVKLVDLVNMACIGMLETGYTRRDIEALGYFMELLGDRLRERYEQEVGSPYDEPDVRPMARPSDKGDAVTPTLPPAL